MAEFSSGSNVLNVQQEFTFPGDLNTDENDLIPIRQNDVSFKVSLLKVVLDGNGQPAPSGADVKIKFYKVVLATGAQTLIGTVTVTAGTLVGSTPISPGVDIIAGTHGTRAAVDQIGSINPGHTGTFTIIGG